MRESTIPKKNTKEPVKKSKRVSEVFPLTMYATGKHYYRECDLEEDKAMCPHRSLGNYFRGGHFLMDVLPKELPLGSAIRVTFEVVPADENRDSCNVEERDQLTDTHHRTRSNLPTPAEGGTGDPDK